MCHEEMIWHPPVSPVRVGLVRQVVVASAAQDKERGEAQEATLLRDAKLDELDQWVSDYKKIAQVAVSDSPQQLEQLGWVVAS